MMEEIKQMWKSLHLKRKVKTFKKKYFRARIMRTTGKLERFANKFYSNGGEYLSDKKLYGL